MVAITLTTSTGNARIDRVIQGVIGLFELTFPDRVRGYYLIGSYSDNSDIATSDLDLVTIFKGDLTGAEDAKVDLLCDYCNHFCPVELDFNARSENDIPIVYKVLLKQASTPLYGEDIREKIVLPGILEYGRRILHNSIGISLRLRKGPGIWHLPLDYPDPAADFYGYATRKLTLPDGSTQVGIKDMIVLAGWASTALIALKAGQYAARKSESFQKYRALINDEWAGLLDKIDQRCRKEWLYMIPGSPDARAELKEICREVLKFENYCFSVYEEVVLADLANPQPNEKLLAVRRAGLINFGNGNKEIKERLEDLGHGPDNTIRQAARESLAKLNADTLLGENY